jgi:DNA-binding response OmpR family regulator
MKHKILPVEDNESIRDNTTKLLEFHNYTVTASGEKKERETGIKMGADDYIIKQFTGEHLLQVLEKNLG